MKLNIDKSLPVKKVRLIVNRVIKTLRKSYFNTVDFQYKLDHLTINIIPDNPDKSIKGEFLYKKGKADLFINSTYFDNDIEYTIFVLTHELMHLNFLRNPVLSDFCRTDNTYAKTEIQRYNGKKHYGRGLEECIASYIGVKMVSVIKKCPYSVALNKIPAKSLHVKTYHYIEELIDIFEKQVIFQPNILYDASNALLSKTIEFRNITSLIEEIDINTYFGFWENLMIKFDEGYTKGKYTPEAELAIQKDFDELRCAVKKIDFLKSTRMDDEPDDDYDGTVIFAPYVYR